ncbi:MAG: RNA-guided endonuclease InsQ/TnpB family protein [bacterium]
MRLSFKFKPTITHKKLGIIREFSWHTSKLYNATNYAIQNDDELSPVYTKLDREFKYNWHCEYLHSHNRQHCLKQLASDWKSYFNSLKDYKKNPGKYKGMPKPPKYKHVDKNPNEVIFTKLAVRVQENTLLLSLSKKIKSKYGVDSLNFELPQAVQSYINLETLQQVRIKYDRLSKKWYLLVFYKTEEKEKDNWSNMMGVDLGLDNLAALTFRDNADCYLIHGKTAKSKNSYFNKEIAKLQNIRMKQVGSKKFKDSKKIKQLRLKRKNYINDYLHKASRAVVDLAIKHQVSTIVLGDIKNIKQGNKAKSFVQIPIQRFAEMIEYKAKLEGIDVVKINESFTSGCSALDLEKLNRQNYDKSRRFVRGLFKTKIGVVINSDQNGSLNIIRKYLKDRCSLRPVERARDNGFVDNPIRLRVS